jgi:acetyltransferase-like isoleucine patch superfamily enzyme
MLTTSTSLAWDISYPDHGWPITIGHDVWIGANVTILPNTTIGNWAVIWAWAIITKDIPPYAIAVWNPAKIIKYRFDEPTIQKLQDEKWWEKDIKGIRAVYKQFLPVEF